MSKYIHLFQTLNDYNYARTNNYIEPWVSATLNATPPINYNKILGTARIVTDEGDSTSIRTDVLTMQQATSMIQSLDGCWDFWSSYGNEPLFKLILEGPVTNWNLYFSDSFCYSVTLPDGIERIGYDSSSNSVIFQIVDALGKYGLLTEYPDDYWFEINLPVSVTYIGSEFIYCGDKYTTNYIINYPGTTQQWNSIQKQSGDWAVINYYNGCHLLIRCSNGDILDPVFVG